MSLRKNILSTALAFAAQFLGAKTPEPAASAVALYSFPPSNISKPARGDYGHGEADGTKLRVDEFGTPWVISGTRLYSLKNGTWKEPAKTPADTAQWVLKKSDGFFARSAFQGGSDRGVYLFSWSNEENTGQLFRLRNHQVEKVARLPREQPNVYVSRNGTIFSYGDDALGVFKEGKWLVTQTPLGMAWSVFESFARVWFCNGSNVYSADSTGEIRIHPAPQFSVRAPYVTSVLWGTHKLFRFVQGKPLREAIDLETGQPVPLPEALENYPEINSAATSSKGDVLFSALHVSARMAGDGTITKLFWPITVGKDFGFFLEDGKGTLISSYREGGIDLLFSDRSERWGWQFGCAGKISNLVSDSKGHVWFLNRHHVGKITLGKGSPELRPETEFWEEYPGGTLWEAGSGKLAMCRADTRKKISMWNGSDWQHLDFQESGQVWGGFDDQHRSHVFSGDKAYEIVAGKLQPRGRPLEWIGQLVGQGVQQLHFGKNHSAVILPNNRAYYSEDGSPKYYDGNSWQHVNAGPGDLCPSLEGGAVFGSSEYGWKRLQENRAIEYTKAVREDGDFTPLIAGELGVQPYEKNSTLSADSSRFPILRTTKAESGNPNYFDELFFDSTIFEEVSRGNSQQRKHGIVLPGTVSAIRPAPSGGYWIYLNKRNGSNDLPYARTFPPVILPIDFSNTQLEEREIHSIFEDAKGDVWFGEQRYNTGAWRHRISKLRLQCPAIPRQCGRILSLLPKVTPAGQSQGVHLLGNTGNDWILQSHDTQRIVFRFPISGTYFCKIIGVKLGGRLPHELSFQVQASVNLPETILQEPQQNPFLLADWEWQPPVTMKPTSPTANAELLWRVDDLPWQKMNAAGALDLTQIPSGPHSLEFCAEEEGTWRDQTPVRVNIMIAPDYSRFMDARLNDLTSAEENIRSQARQQLLRIPQSLLPALREKQTQANEAARQAQSLRNAIFQIRNEQNRN